MDTKALPSPETKRHYSAPMHFKVVDAEQGIAEFFPCVFNNIDHAKERLLPGSLKKSIEEKLPKGVWSHDWSTPIAKTLVAEECLPGDSRLPDAIKKLGGLYVKAQFNLETQRGREAFSDLKFGTMDEFSFGYYVLDAEYDSKGVLNLKECEIVEWSPVLKGCNPKTQLVSVKSAEPALRVKSEFLGYWAEEDAAMAAVRALNQNLMWGPLYNCLFPYDEDDAGTLDERMTTLSKAFDEFRDISLRLVRALCSTSDEAGMKAARAELKALYPPFEDPSLAGESFKSRLQSVLALVEDCTERAQGIQSLRAKDGRQLPADRLEQIAALRSALDALITHVTVNDAQESVSDAETKAREDLLASVKLKQLQRKADLRRIAVGL